ncbi:ComF family protein [Modestobacter lapidis]|nr:ComF family protein [Modestobacter lapidis]
MTDLVLPRTCAGCGVPGCDVCPRCGRWLTAPRLAAPRRHPPGLPPTVAAGPYAGPVRPVVLAFKEHGRAELARPLGAALALAVTVLLRAGPDLLPGSGPVLLVPVPSSAAAVQRRGRDHVRELAGCAAAELRAAGVPARPLPVLRRARGTRDSAGLDARERRRNLAGRFRGRPPPGGALPRGILVLVDDVVTSGATLTEAARALAALLAAGLPAGGPPGAGRQLGNAPVVAAVVAATPRRPLQPAHRDRPATFTVRS